MRRSALVLALIMAVAAPTAALAAKKAAAPADPNAPAKKFVATGLQQPVVIWNAMWSPWWTVKTK